MSFDYKSSFESARTELARVQERKLALGQELEQCDKQIVALIQAMRAIAPLVGENLPDLPSTDSEMVAGGMTDCVRAILKKAAEPLTASEIRESLESVGFDMNSYSNPLATIHTVLRRLTESGEVETTHEMFDSKKFTLPVSKHLAVEKIIGKDYQIGKMKGFIGVGRLRRRSHVQDNVQSGK
jgi:hypothetical protein